MPDPAGLIEVVPFSEVLDTEVADLDNLLLQWSARSNLMDAFAAFHRHRYKMALHLELLVFKSEAGPTTIAGSHPPGTGQETPGLLGQD